MPASAPGSARTCRGLAGKLRVPESPVRPEEACLPQPGVLAGAGALMPGSLSWLSQGSCSPGELTCQAGRRSWSRAGTEMGNGRGDTVRAGRGCAEKQWPPGPGVRPVGGSAGPSPPQALVTTASQWARQTSGCPVGRAGRVHPCGPGTRAVTSSRLGRVHVGACGHLLEFLHASITGRARSCVHRPPCGSTSMYNRGCRQRGPRSVLGPTAEPVREGPFDKLQYQLII